MKKMPPIMLRPLEEHEIETVHEWLRSMDMPVNRLLHRDYADGVLLAKLLKKLFPRHVEMHNYQRRLSLNLKIINWKALESKILKRLGIKLTPEQIETLARGEVGTIERLLWLIMKEVANGRTLESADKQHQQQQQQQQRKKAATANALKENSKNVATKRNEKVNIVAPVTVVVPSRHRQSLHSKNNNNNDDDDGGEEIGDGCNATKTTPTITTTTATNLHQNNINGNLNSNTNTNANANTNTKNINNNIFTTNLTNSSPSQPNQQSNNYQCNNLEKALNEFRVKIESLEELFKKRDDDIQILLERERANAAESPELKKILGSIKSKVNKN